MNIMDIVIRDGLGNWEVSEYDGYREPKCIIKVEDDYVITKVEVLGINREGITVKALNDNKLFIRTKDNNKNHLLIKELSAPATAKNSHAKHRNRLLMIRLLIKDVGIGDE
ncbi:hypothetical protein [Vulcanisaeta distributa]|uniref:hypothetical protein n=1 Tax=Vulcanisaeta distributa TaxID=164451 RepID=UPI000A97403B|nr:hypothetical protein [Vulcanisaeta distributa]